MSLLKVHLILWKKKSTYVKKKLKTRQKRCLKSTNFYQREDYISVSQTVSRARQVPQDLRVHLDREDTKELGDEEGRKEELETREIKVLWDRQERADIRA